jgi:hypothetical protein
MAFDQECDGSDRPKVLKCMIWAGTGVLWTIEGGVPKSFGLVGEALAKDVGGFTCLQISDSHVGFNKPANPNVIGTLEVRPSRIFRITGVSCPLLVIQATSKKALLPNLRLFEARIGGPDGSIFAPPGRRLGRGGFGAIVPVSEGSGATTGPPTCDLATRSCI